MGLKKVLAAVLLALQLKAHAVPQDRDSLRCLAEAVYREARGESQQGKQAVAQVVINRLKHPAYPKTICEVIYQPGQFQWTKRYKTTLPDLDSWLVAREAILNYHKPQKFVATHFHSSKVQPGWKFIRVAQIGNHVFYYAKQKQPA